MSEISNDMRGTLWVLSDGERKENGPVATGLMEIAGVKLRVAMWPKRKVAKPGSKADGKTYLPISVEYPQGTTKFLCPVNPANVTVESAVASNDGTGESTTDNDDSPMPF